uniref:Putative U6 snRNA-associated Sm-like protein LSm4 n=1 Tax=Rhizophora mucronata TaxID=61149 RepID=A0A2P2JUU1_RHIMU
MNVHPSITIYQMPIVSFPIFKLHKHWVPLGRL